jgi:hypothetical protein
VSVGRFVFHASISSARVVLRWRCPDFSSAKIFFGPRQRLSSVSIGVVPKAAHNCRVHFLSLVHGGILGLAEDFFISSW